MTYLAKTYDENSFVRACRIEFFKHFVCPPVFFANIYHDTSPHQKLHHFLQTAFAYRKHNMIRCLKKPPWIQILFHCHFVFGHHPREFVLSFFSQSTFEKSLIGIWTQSVSDCVRDNLYEKTQKQLC